MNKKLLKEKDIDKVVEILMETHKDAKVELDHKNPFELLIATILSAQCTDKRVNSVTPKLFEVLKEPKDIFDISLEDLEKIIKPCGLYKTKAKNIISCCKDLENIYNGKIPKEKSKLVKLAGVGVKTANVVVSNAFGTPAIAVDTHVKRVSNRLGLVDDENVNKVENRLMKIIDKDKWTKMHHVLIFHGRRVCSSRSPKCEGCTVKDICVSNKK